MRALILTACWLVSGGLLAAQGVPDSAALTSAEIERIAETIQAEAIARDVSVLAHDSMRGRETPSRELELTAQYIGERFRHIGLQPIRLDPVATGEPSLITRCPIPGDVRIDYDASRVHLVGKIRRNDRDVLKEDSSPVWKGLRIGFATDAWPAADTARVVPGSMGTGLTERMFVVSGRQSVASIRRANLHDKFVLYLPPTGTDIATKQVIAAALTQTNDAVLIVSDEDSTTFAREIEAARRRGFWYDNRPSGRARSQQGWSAHVRAGAVRDYLEVMGVDVARAHADTLPSVKQVLALRYFELESVIDSAASVRATIPNVVGLLPGASSEFIVVSAYMDAGGRAMTDPRAGIAPDDNAAGVAGLLALATALAQPGARPRRSILFVATSGGVKDFWGAECFAETSRSTLRQGAFDLALDWRGGVVSDSVGMAGLHDVDWAVRPDRLMTMYPELGVTVVDRGTSAVPESDHFAFIEHGIPVLYVTNNTAFDGKTANAPPAFDAEHAARVTRLLFHVVRAEGNADRSPKWSSAGRLARLKAVGD